MLDAAHGACDVASEVGVCFAGPHTQGGGGGAGVSHVSASQTVLPNRSSMWVFLLCSAIGNTLDSEMASQMASVAVHHSRLKSTLRTPVAEWVQQE